MLHGGHARALPAVSGAVALLLEMGGSHVYAGVDLLIFFSLTSSIGDVLFG